MEEPMRRSEMIMQLKFDVLEVFAAAAIDYLVLTTLWDQVQKRLERRFNRGIKMDTAKSRPVVEQA
jgi:polar amino acid transport system permease protein